MGESKVLDVPYHSKFDLRKLNTIEEWKVFVKAILGTAGDQSAAVRLFLWMSADAEDWKGDVDDPQPRSVSY